MTTPTRYCRFTKTDYFEMTKFCDKDVARMIWDRYVDYHLRHFGFNTAAPLRWWTDADSLYYAQDKGTAWNSAA